MKKQNAKQVRRGVLKFAISFMGLCIFSFCVFFFFYKSFEFQNRKIKDDIVAYKGLLNKQQLLKQKLDTIYNNMQLINSGKVSNNIFLENYISKDIQEVRTMIGADSASEFNHYSYLLTNLDKMLKLKDTMTQIEKKEEQALRDLRECTGNISKVKKELSTDPTRGFSTR